MTQIGHLLTGVAIGVAACLKINRRGGKQFFLPSLG